MRDFQKNTTFDPESRRCFHKENVRFTLRQTERESHRSIDGIQHTRIIPKKKEFFSFSFRSYFSSGMRTVRRFRRIHSETMFFVLGKRGMIVSMAVGVVCTGFLSYLFFGSRAMAEDATPVVMVVQQRVLGAETEKLKTISDKDAFERDIREMVKGYPIEDMVPYIAKQDRRVAAYLVAIAKKESNWGKRIPVYYGENCFNYWGYRGQDEIMGSAGHTCFDTPKDAVTTVAKRLNTLVLEQGLVTAEQLVVWKCGSSCAGHDAYDVSKWISDVDEYYQRVLSVRKEQ